jgi:hypothetical protein
LFGSGIHSVIVARKKGSDGSDPFFGSGSSKIGEAYCPPESGGQHDRDVVVIVRGVVPKPHPYNVRLGTTPALRATPPDSGGEPHDSIFPFPTRRCGEFPEVSG